MLGALYLSEDVYLLDLDVDSLCKEMVLAMQTAELDMDAPMDVEDQTGFVAVHSVVQGCIAMDNTDAVAVALGEAARLGSRVVCARGGVRKTVKQQYSLKASKESRHS